MRKIKKETKNNYEYLLLIYTFNIMIRLVFFNIFLFFFCCVRYDSMYREVVFFSAHSD